MCGRFTITATKAEMDDYLRNYFSITNFNIDDYTPRYNASPTQNILSIISDGYNYRAGFLKWGFVPEYAKDMKFFSINSRAETIDEKPTFKKAFLTKRCIIPVDSFYEWKKKGTKKTPLRILMKDEKIFALAGIWNTTIINDTKIHTFSIVTSKANDLMANIHDRMPVILDHDKIPLWLDPTNRDPNLLKSLLVPYDDNKMTFYEVSSEVNSSRIDKPDLINKIKV